MARSQAVLVCNGGSSSIKFAVVDPESGLQALSGIAERLHSPQAVLRWQAADQDQQQPIPNADHAQALKALIAILNSFPSLQLAAVGHRIVHGGEHFSAPVLLGQREIGLIEDCAHLAPLHNPAHLQGIHAAQQAFPDLPQVGVFDTAFHQSMPPRAYRYAVPEEWYQKYAVRRYGFHGTSHAYVAAEAARRLGRSLPELALITAHLGNGCSATAIAEGQSQDTTMGLTPLEGLVMGTRSGDVDPSLIGYMARRSNRDAESIIDALNRESGLKGLSNGGGSDMRQLLAQREDGNEEARLALDVFCYRLAKHLSGLVVALGRLDGLIFTGGIGENSSPIRAQTCELLTFLGIQIEDQRNADHGRHHDGRISSDASIPVLVVPTNEELQIARETMMIILAKTEE